jgi:hypothetical protein
MGKWGDEKHYTPEAVARLLAALAIRSANDLVLDPSCGDGRLLVSALQLKQYLRRQPSVSTLGNATDAVDATHADRPLGREQVFGIDRSRRAVRLAALTGARVTAADFFQVVPGRCRLPHQFDAIIGNPPYIRQEAISPRDKQRIARCLIRDQAFSQDIFWPRWSGRSDIYVYFFAHAVRFLRRGGRLAFLTASSWLDVEYGTQLREFLLKNFRILAIIESAAENFFACASVGTAITLLERRSSGDDGNRQIVRFVKLLAPLDQIASSFREAVDFARSIERQNSSALTATHCIRTVEQSELIGATSWGKYLRADDVFFKIIERGAKRLQPLSAMASMRFGMKTGANEFFYVTERNKVGGELARLSEVAEVRRGLTTGANEFFYVRAVRGVPPNLVEVENGSGVLAWIEAEYLSPVIFSLRELDGIIIRPDRISRFVFNCTDSESELAGSYALRYIRSGEHALYNKRPSCAARDPWYAVVRDRKRAPLIFPSKVGERWLVALNRAGAFEDKKFYGIFPHKGVRAALLAALLNSTWARYYAEMTCRQMTGAQAIADIDVRVALNLLLPDPRLVGKAVSHRCEAALRVISRRRVLSIFEEVKQEDRQKLDDAVLRAIGFTRKSERRSLLEQLYRAACELVRARIARSSSKVMASTSAASQN